MRVQILSVVLLFFAIATSKAPAEDYKINDLSRQNERPGVVDTRIDDDRAFLRQQIAQLQGQLARLDQMRADRDVAMINIAAGNAGPADKAAVANYEAAKAQFAPVAQQLQAVQSALSRIEEINRALGTLKPPQDFNYLDPHRPFDQSEMRRWNRTSSDDSHSGQSTASHGPSDHTTSTSHSGDSEPGHSHTGDSHGHSGTSHSGSDGHSGSSGHHGQSSSGHSSGHSNSSGHSGDDHQP